MLTLSVPPPKRRDVRALVGVALTLIGALASPAARAESGDSDHAATEALEAFTGAAQDKNVIQNKFFLKQNRFEIAPSLGIMPNNAFVTNVYGGAVLAYHFSETFAAEGTLLYAPNTGAAGVKGLTVTLVDIAAQGGTTAFQQPLDRLQLGALFAARWTPVYGKINLIGETVANFDLYGTGGVGLLLITNDFARVADPYDPAAPSTSRFELETNPTTGARPALNLGLGMDFFISQSIAFKLDVRSTPYFAPEPDYGDAVELENRLYTPVLATAGVSIFVPKMKPRQYNF